MGGEPRDQFLDPLLIAALALNFAALGVSRIRAVVNTVALQGILLGVLPLFMPHHEIALRNVLLIVVTVGLKGFAIPWFLIRAMREADIQHEVRPVFSYTLPLAEKDVGYLVVPASLATVWTGFLMLTTRRKAIMQVVGYLLLENGIFLFGLLLLEAMPFLVEVGVLLDLFTGVFVMGIIIHHISREFASISTEHLTELKE